MSPVVGGLVARQARKRGVEPGIASEHAWPAKEAPVQQEGRLPTFVINPNPRIDLEWPPRQTHPVGSSSPTGYRLHVAYCDRAVSTAKQRSAVRDGEASRVVLNGDLPLSRFVPIEWGRSLYQMHANS